MEISSDLTDELVWICWSPIKRLPRWRIGEGSPDMVGTVVDQNQYHCLVEKVDLQGLGEETPTENQPAQRL